jgi:hypothetical protein
MPVFDNYRFFLKNSLGVPTKMIVTNSSDHRVVNPPTMGRLLFTYTLFVSISFRRLPFASNKSGYFSRSVKADVKIAKRLRTTKTRKDIVDWELKLEVSLRLKTY